MAEKDKDFDLDRLDQQIERPAGSLDARASRLVADLQWMYRPSLADTRADAQSLQRVRRLLEARLQNAPQDTKIVPLTTFKQHQERKSSMNHTTNARASGWSRLSRALSTLAAVLTVAVLIGSAATLAYLKTHSQNVGQKTNVGASAYATTTPQPKLDCSHIFAYEDGSYPDNGEHAVCLQNLETPLRGTTTVGETKVSLLAAYADANRLLVKYAIAGKRVTIPNGGVYLSTLTIQGGVQIQPAAAAGGYYYDAQHQQTVYLESFDTQSLPTSITTLHATAHFFALSIDNPGNGNSSSLDFTVHMQKAKRVATPNQSTVINGHTITLQRVVVTASLTMLYLKVDPKLAPYALVQLLGNINGKEALLEGATDQPGNGKSGNLTGWYGPVQEDLLNKQGVWTLSLHNIGGPLGVGSGMIHFTVPPVA